MDKKELAVVVPFFNEANNLKKLISDWSRVLNENNISYRFILINDGSTDNSLSIAEDPSLLPDITLLNQKNSGHGAAILNGYHHAVSYDWIFQIDSDHQYRTDTFTEMWNKKGEYNFLIAERKDISASFSRKIISLLCNRSVGLIFGEKIPDINCPYRLIRSSLLQKCLERIPPSSFAPNVLMSVYIIKNKIPVYNAKLYFRPSLIPNRSKLNRKLFRGSVQTFMALLFKL